jgi:glycosyltransferase involved in cell wall biosynthesis
MRRVLLALEPPDGGVAENVLQLALGLGAHGWEVELAGPGEAIIYPEAQSAGVTIHRLDLARGYGAPARDARALRDLRALLRSGRFDLVHCHSAKVGVLGRLAARASRVPCVYSPHCFPFVGDFGAPRRIVATTIERALAPLAARTICVCEDEREQAGRAGLKPERLRVVRNGCDACPNGFEPDPALLALRDGGVVGAAVAVLREQKRLDVLVDAAPDVLRRLPEARLAIVGDGPLRDQLHERARTLGLDAEPRFAFLPFGAPAARHLRAADVYVLPSGWEALPIGVLEAMACGVPQVATDVGGTGEAVAPETGVLVPPGDPGALADALVDLLGDADRRAAMAEASVARHRERFTVERMVAETAAVYAEALEWS